MELNFNHSYVTIQDAKDHDKDPIYFPLILRYNDRALVSISCWQELPPHVTRQFELDEDGCGVAMVPLQYITSAHTEEEMVDIWALMEIDDNLYRQAIG